MECRFHLGQKVVCVFNDIPDSNLHADEIVPPVGAVLTVDDIIPFEEGAGLHFAEISNPKHYDNGTGDAYFWHGDFRPIHETQIEEFRQAAIKAAREAKAPRKSRAGQPMAPVGFMR